MIAATGPKISSLATRIDKFTSASTVGWTKKPEFLPFFSFPPRYTSESAESAVRALTGDNLCTLLARIFDEIDYSFVLIFID
jgi:hypothetical protein